jgi:hypothetical protein
VRKAMDLMKTTKGLGEAIEVASRASIALEGL